MTLPDVTITESALRALRDASPDLGDDEVLHLKIDAAFQNDLYFAPLEPDEVVVVASGVKLAMDARTTRRAHGLTIDYISDSSSGSGFKIDNPNQSSPIKGIRPADLAWMLEKREEFRFIDVRPEQERERARLEAARPLDAAHRAELEALPKNTKLVFMGHHSSDGRVIAQEFVDRGFSNVWLLVGGIDAWSTMAPEVPRY